jgi:biotin carboxyl carrier protein
MKIIANINDQNTEIELSVHPCLEHGFIAKIDGREVLLDLIERKPTSLTLAIDGRVGFYDFNRDKGRIAEVVHDCRTFRVSMRNQQQDQLEKLLEEFGAGMGGQASQTMVTAPMPGKILGVTVKVGDKLELGQIICVLEAMKMENEISSTVEGVVRTLHMKVGDTMNANDPLLEIEPRG